MPKSKPETMLENYAGLTVEERAEFRAMLAGYDVRYRPAEKRAKKARKPAEDKSKTAEVGTRE